MANIFAWGLAIATVITGIMWCIERFKVSSIRKAKIKVAQQQDQKPSEQHTIATSAGKPSTWFESIASLFPVLAFVFIIRSFIFEPFQIPSGSMMPTLLIGDFILVQKFAYGIKDPLFHTTLIKTGEPKRGDVVVFRYPLNPQEDYIKRVIGLPGDKVIYQPMSKQLTIIPACHIGTVCDKPLNISYTTPQPSQFVSLRTTSTQKGGLYQLSLSDHTFDGVRLDILTEKLGNVSHQILVNPDIWIGFAYRQPGQMPGVYQVPAGHYFVLGDNRDNSADSRFWGFVPEKNLVGKAVAIWMSFKKNENEWPTGVRLSRIGAIH